MNWYCVEHLKYIFKVYLFSGPRSPLSDYHKVIASNQYALPILAYATWPQAWPLSELAHITQCPNKRFFPSNLSFSVRLDGQRQCKDKAFIPHGLQNGRRVIKVNYSNWIEKQGR